jgi:hypothetical protein
MPAVGLDDLSGNGQTQACSADVSVRQARDAEEFIEDPLEIFFRDPDAVVAHAHLELAADHVRR